ncbi:MAG: hypothetical protein IPI52_05595 [Bacteroidetes bacterium]|nr:hypothetical protein [Bacteroidota bacterium]
MKKEFTTFGGSYLYLFSFVAALTLQSCKRTIDLSDLPTKQLSFTELPVHIQSIYKEAAFHPKYIVYFSSTNKEDSVSYELITRQHYVKMLINGYTIRFYINGKKINLDRSKHGIKPFIFDNEKFYYIDGFGLYSEFDYLERKINCVDLPSTNRANTKKKPN